MPLTITPILGGFSVDDRSADRVRHVAVFVHRRDAETFVRAARLRTAVECFLADLDAQQGDPMRLDVDIDHHADALQAAVDGTVPADPVEGAAAP